MESLAEIFKRHAVYGQDVGHADKGSTHSYIDVYESLLAPYRAECAFMEIGLALGWSMKMFGEYFGPKSKLTGADISIVFDTKEFDERFDFIQSDATKLPFLEAIGIRGFDVIIDDASHMMQDQVDTFNLLKGHVKKGGLYIIEDILSPESALPVLTALHPAEVFDLRKVKGRFDDVLVAYRF